MISVFIDTNVLYCRNEKLTEAGFANNLQEIVDDIGVNDIYTEVKIVLPSMVIYELYHQQLEAYETWKKQLEKIEMPNLQYDEQFNYESYLSKIFKEALWKIQQGVVNVEVVGFPSNDKLNRIILRAIEKEPPFEGKDKQSDKGFKDVVIWETIKEYKENHINDIIVFCCKDKLLTSNELKEEFNVEFRDDIYTESRDKLIEILNHLCKKKGVTQSFSSQLKERIYKSISDHNEILYDLLMEDNTWQDGEEIYDFKISKVNIISCDDRKKDNKIKYNVEADILLTYSTQRDREGYKNGGIRQFDIYYDFETDELLLKEYDSLTLGRCEWNDFLQIER